MGQSMSLCGSRNRLGRSPSLSFNDQPGLPDSLPALYGRKDEMKDDDEFAPSESYYRDAASEQLKHEQRVVERTDDSDEDEEEQTAHRVHTHSTLRRDKSCAQLSAFSSSSSLHTSPNSNGSDHAYYTTDEESPLSSASSSSSLSAQASPPRVFSTSTLPHHSSSHSITVSQPTSYHPLVNSHPFTHHRIDVTSSQPHSQLRSQPEVHTPPTRPLTTSLSTSCLHRASYMGEGSDEEMIPHSRSYQHLQSAQWQQQSSGATHINRFTATHSYSSSSLSLSITRPTSASSASSSPDSAPPTASYPSSASTLLQDSQPVVTHNAVITIRPNVSSISLNTARTFRTHRRPIALDSPTPSPVRHSDVEDDSPTPVNSRSLFRSPSSSFTFSGSGSSGVVCHSGLMLDQQPLSPGSYPGTCLSILRAQRTATVC